MLTLEIDSIWHFQIVTKTVVLEQPERLNSASDETMPYARLPEGFFWASSQSHGAQSMRVH